ncbi:MAG: hypothetical protein KA224_04700, partial [Steroidobacteraceae bacterium]|nr:hypothetical protein [Steroidobacteraceae bacterium]
MISGTELWTRLQAAAARLPVLRSGHIVPDEADYQAPLRAELFNSDQMEQHGKGLAARHVIDGNGSPDRLLTRLGENERILTDTCGMLTVAAKAQLRMVPAAEWLVDN